MYQADAELVQTLKEWNKNNPFNIHDYSFTSSPSIPSPMKGQAPWNKGIPNTWNHKISDAMKGIPRKFPKQIEAARKNAVVRNSTMYECIHCGKVNNLGNHRRYHGDKCKLFNSSVSDSSY
jgi:hypothetical protein